MEALPPDRRRTVLREAAARGDLATLRAFEGALSPLVTPAELAAARRDLAETAHPDAAQAVRDADTVLQAVEGADRLARSVLRRLAGDLAKDVEDALRERDHAERIRANRERLGRDPDTGQLRHVVAEVLPFEGEGAPLPAVVSSPNPGMQQPR